MTTSMYCLYVEFDYTYIDVNACMYVCIDVRMYVLMYVLMYDYICVFCVLYIHRHKRTDTRD